MMAARLNMGIPERLWGVLREKGYGSIEEMARAESLVHGLQIPAGTLYSWMTNKARHRRRPLDPRSLKVVSLITGRSPGQLMDEMVAEEARETSAAS